jgi:hypothetical protein
MSTTAVSLSNIRALDLGPERTTSLALDEDTALNQPSAAAVAGCLVAFAPEVSARHQRDVLESLLLAQLAANAKAERHKDPAAWFRAYVAVLEQVAWVLESSTSAARFPPQTSTFTVESVISHAFRGLTPDELALVKATLAAFRSGNGDTAPFVFECPSHSGGIGNFQVALATEENGVLSLRIAQVSFNAAQHVTRLLQEQFPSSARFQVASLVLTQNEQIYATIRNAVAGKVESRFQGAVALLPLS